MSPEWNSIGNRLFEDIFSFHITSPLLIEITKKVPPVEGTIILFLTTNGLAVE